MIFISGGVRSGKSTYAEEIIDQFDNKVYIATSVAYDDEMEERVMLHQERRHGYQTIEQSKDLKSIINQCKDKNVLLDCLTNWLSNEMFQDEFTLDVTDKMFKTILELDEVSNTLVIVSNDVFQGVSNYDEYTLRYLQNLGDLHQKIVKRADEVYELYAGLKIRRK